MNLEQVIDRHGFSSISPLIEAKVQFDMVAWLVASLKPLFDECSQNVANLELAYDEASKEADELKKVFDDIDGKYQAAHQQYQGTLELTETRLEAGKAHAEKNSAATTVWRSLSEAKLKRDALAAFLDDLERLDAPSEQAIRDKVKGVLG